ncbi:hypothetical protein HPB49_010934 [Dermacentor silvarum]|uniref:Uncharacterized protein n=1 Tax=Dermacentor silvarum TaxID=543639 RepID=A0ACB8C338_DERSI|nr:hypothetical protein HPB49_010934 [Dermacentor silvarum]
MVAMKRLQCLLRRLSKSEDLLLQYDTAVTQYLKDGHPKPVPSHHTVKDKTYCIPYHEVIKESSTTTKQPVVFDASLHTAGATYLSDHPEKDLNIDLCKMLSFRIHKIGSFKKWKPFFRNPVSEMQDLTVTPLWNRCF